MWEQPTRASVTGAPSSAPPARGAAATAAEASAAVFRKERRSRESFMFGLLGDRA
jgi:hypothetical protein